MGQAELWTTWPNVVCFHGHQAFKGFQGVTLTLNLEIESIQSLQVQSDITQGGIDTLQANDVIPKPSRVHREVAGMVALWVQGNGGDTRVVELFCDRQGDGCKLCTACASDGQTALLSRHSVTEDKQVVAVDCQRTCIKERRFHITENMSNLAKIQKVPT